MSGRNDPIQLAGEEWRKIKRYPGYEVSNLGRFRSYWTSNGLSDTPRIKSIIFNRFMKVSVKRLDGTHTLVEFSRLVAEVFIGKPRNRLVINLDGDIKNCRVDNLAYVTRDEFSKILAFRRYMKYGEKSTLGRKKAAERKYQARLRRALEVESLRDNEHLTFREIGERTGISESAAFRIYTGSNNSVLEKAKANQ